MAASPNLRAALTVDQHGVIVAANAAVATLFGHPPAECIDKSLRTLIEQIPRPSARSKRYGERGSEVFFFVCRFLTAGLVSLLGADRFSQSDLWRAFVSEVTAQRVVNGKHRGGELIPVLLTSSAVISGGGRVHLYALVFEDLPKDGATLTCSPDGIIQSSTANVESILGCSVRDICGQSLHRFVRGNGSMDVFQASLEAGKRLKKKAGAAVDVFGTPRQMGAPGIPLTVRVLDDRDELIVVSVQLRNPVARKAAEPGSVENSVDLSAKGGVNQTEVREEVMRCFVLCLTMCFVLQKVAVQEVGLYSVSDALGVGQGGVVRKGVHRTTGAIVAVKTIARDTFVTVSSPWPGREFELMRHLNHENVVQLYDCVSTPNCQYLILELVQGGELLSFCFDSGALEEKAARPLFRDIMSAVDYLHRKGIVHRDLKLENCLLDQLNRVKLIDFGLANWFVPGEQLKTSCGSTDYAAPELLNGSKGYNAPPVDVWALGVMLYAMVAGTFPFATVAASLEGKYNWPATVTVTKMLKNLIGSIFELKPQSRVTMDLLRLHEWVNEGFSGPPARPQIIVCESEPQTKRDILAPRADLLLEMETAFALPMEAAVQSLFAEEVNVMTATYKLLSLQHPKPIAAAPDRLANATRLIKEAELRSGRGDWMDVDVMRNAARVRLSPRANHHRAPSFVKRSEDGVAGISPSAEAANTTVQFRIGSRRRSSTFGNMLKDE